VKLDTYWLDWQPLTEKVEKELERSPSKPAKPSSEGFAGATLRHFQTISPLEPLPEAFEEGFECWVKAQCVFREAAWGGLGALHSDYSDWCDKVGKEVPGSLRTFKTLIQELGFRITDDGLVYGLLLSEDLRLPGKVGRK
jgi:hypothetical protein